MYEGSSNLTYNFDQSVLVNCYACFLLVRLKVLFPYMYTRVLIPPAQHFFGWICRFWRDMEKQ